MNHDMNANDPNKDTTSNNNSSHGENSNWDSSSNAFNYAANYMNTTAGLESLPPLPGHPESDNYNSSFVGVLGVDETRQVGTVGIGTNQGYGTTANTTTTATTATTTTTTATPGGMIMQSSNLLRHLPTAAALATAATVSLPRPDNGRKRPRSEIDRRSKHTCNMDEDATWSSTTVPNKALTTMQELTLIRVVARMLRDQADLCNQQASQLEHISRNIHNKEAWFQIVHDDKGSSYECQNYETVVDNSDKDGKDKHGQDDDECQREIKELKHQMHEYKSEREAVITLSTKCYQGMKQLQKNMDAFLQTQRMHPSYQSLDVEQNNAMEGSKTSTWDRIELSFPYDDGLGRVKLQPRENSSNQDESSSDTDNDSAPQEQQQDAMELHQRDEENVDKTSDSGDESQEDYESSILGSFLNNPGIKPIEVVPSNRRIRERSDDSFSSSSDD
eukprot:CAMPEP_0176485352 /NCGR_PEP_ID=MMETSP0200_2-20121128/4993_1 /TAXON_ID=947934 /ORGANISM="Chaetoceros sp., Strain GSL56" /LENGTH=445 /DNA_ID=CAMNT_0017881989 /DNA_START=2577 /DNA_END=3914 /DNA_ORIENTATION=+